VDAALTLVPEELAGWVREARSGDREAFERIMVAHQRMVLRVALRMMGGRMEDAQDAAQEVFLKLHRSLHQFDEVRAFTPWLYRMTVNVCLDLLRARPQADPMKDERTVAATAESALLIGERKKAVETALRQLPEKERAAIVLREVEGLSTREVAQVLETSEATVRSQVYQARMRLRKLTEKILGGR
jgi:RNA polymerase sigma-70 factor (ECF subfamily)